MSRAAMLSEISSTVPRAAVGRSWLTDWLDSVPGAVLVGSALLLALTFGKAVAVWRTGMFFGPDDAMRASEVRDFLAGQGWFDLVPKRMSPNHPFAMHWSRLADLPLAGLVLAFRQVTDAGTAERLTRLVEPALLYILLLVALARLARDMCGRGGALAVALLVAGSLDVAADFMPGRIHHHALQLLLLATMSTFVCDGLDAHRSARMAWAGMLAALSLAINLQNMPFVLAAAALIGLIWAVQGAPLAQGLERFGFGLAGGATVVFLAQVPPARYTMEVCDAFGAPHLLAGALGGFCFVLLGRASRRLPDRGSRLVAIAVAGAVVGLALRMIYPACLGDPYGAVDALVRHEWMANVGEAMPLPTLMIRDPFGTLPIVIELVLGIGGLLAATAREQGLDRRRWIMLAGLALTGVLGTLWQVRVAASAELFAAWGGAWLLCKLFGRGGERPFRTLLAFITGLAMTTAGWTAALAAFEPAPSQGVEAVPLDPVDINRCFEPSSFEGLRHLPPGLVLSTVDPGAHILVHTEHSVVAGPYHRNADGIRLSLMAFQASPEAAWPMLKEAQVAIIALCTSSVETHDIVRASPNGLAAQILTGNEPTWLTPVDGPGPYRIFLVKTR